MRIGAWTEGLDCRLLGLRASGASWESIAGAMRLSRTAVVERGRRLGARKMVQKAMMVPTEARDRPARPPGHPDSWDLITAGTVLEGASYPFPVFL
jgi:hypothetical protein